jgi:phosphate:Na+ symporter
LILVGVLLRLFGGRRLSAAGYALAGFGLIFVGIRMLQEGMQAFSGFITPESFPDDTFGGRLMLVLIGVGITIVTQSSSAGVAAAMAALYAGAISLPQAAAMVIGMDVGTTCTAMLATIGGSVQARRTGLAHLVFNLMTGTVGLILLTPYTLFIDQFALAWRQSDPELVLAGFHTLFNLVGVAMVLPFTNRFAKLIIRLAPERGNPLTRRLDKKLQHDADFAIGAVRATSGELVQVVFSRLVSLLKGREPEDDVKCEDIRQAIHDTADYLRNVGSDPANETLSNTHQASIHILDHLARLMVRLSNSQRLEDVRQSEELHELLADVVNTARTVSVTPLAIEDATASRQHDGYQTLKSCEKPFRRDAIARAAAGQIDVDTAIAETDAMRWLRRVGYHVWRITHHLHEISDLEHTI